MTRSAREGVALITGAASRIGAVYAHRLAQRGYDLILVARDPEKLQVFAERLRDATGCTVDLLAADLRTRPGRAIVELTLSYDPAITMLVNCAGVGSAESIREADLDVMEAMIDLNVTALTCLTYAAVPGFVARGRGTIINVASVVGLAVEALHGVYGASKAYLLGLGRLLQADLGASGVRVQTVLPGATAAELWNIVGYPPPKAMGATLSAEMVVDTALAGLEAGDTVTFPSLYEAESRDDWQAFSPPARSREAGARRTAA